MPTTASNRLYGLLDSLIALRMEFATGTEGDKDLSPLGREKVMEVRAILDSAIGFLPRRTLYVADRALGARPAG